jgi:nitrate reductase gamma subunit
VSDWFADPLHRRFSDARISAVTRFGDKALLLWILITLALGLSTIFVSASHLDGHMMVLFMSWAQHIFTFRADAAGFIEEARCCCSKHICLWV